MTNFFEKSIAFISPKMAASRARYRYVNKVFEENERKFEGASFGRRTAGWKAGSNSQNSEISSSLSTLRNRSRDLVRNNTYAKKAIQSIGNNVVGLGIRPSLPADLAKPIAKKIKSAWMKWAETTECDFDGKLTFYGIQKLAMRSIAESGEVLIRRRRSIDGIIPIKLQIVEADLIDTNRSTQFVSGSNYVIMGVEFNGNGQKVAYWLFDQHPGDNVMYTNLESRRVPISEFIHIFEVLRPGQIRGIPFGVSSFIRIKDFDEYEDAQLVKQKVSASYCAFVSDPEGEGQVNDDPLERLEPGIVEYMTPGKEITFSTPPTVEGYADYSRKMLQGIAAGFGVSYEIMTGDLSNVNFSSGRMGWIEFQGNVEDWQELMLVPQLCVPVWGWFMTGLLLRGINKDYITASWTPPRRQMIDPVKETNGQAIAVANGLVSWSETVRSNGYNPDEVVGEIIAERKLFKDAGITLAFETPPKVDPNAPTD